MRITVKTATVMMSKKHIMKAYRGHGGKAQWILTLDIVSVTNFAVLWYSHT